MRLLKSVLVVAAIVAPAASASGQPITVPSFEQLQAPDGADMTDVLAGHGDTSIIRAMARLTAKWDQPGHVVSGQPALWQLPRGSTGVHVVKCPSKKKGTLIGAAIGAAAGAAVAVYVIREVSGVLGTANGAPRFLAYLTIGGAGGGALAGFAYCS